MLVINTLLIKVFVTGIMLFCFMPEMLCWFANGEHQHRLIIEFYKHEDNSQLQNCTELSFLSPSWLRPTVIRQVNQQTNSTSP